jgi:hypothetical protein
MERTRRAWVLSAMVMLAVGCAGSGVVHDDPASPTPSASDAIARQADIYAAIIGDGERFGDLLVVDRVCADADGMAASHGCAPMDPALQQALTGRLGRVTFIHDPAPIQERLISKGGVIIYRFGPVSGSGDRVEVPASYWCGGLCGAGSTHVVELVNGTWSVTGSVGAGWIS